LIAGRKMNFIFLPAIKVMMPPAAHTTHTMAYYADALHTAIAELTTGSNTPPTDSTDLWLTM